MVLDLWDQIKDFFNSIGDFVNKNYDNPFFWIVIFLVLLFLAIFTIKQLNDK